MKQVFLYAWVVFALLSCNEKQEQRNIEFVTPTATYYTPSDSLIFEMEGLMQQYAAVMSRSEQGEDVDAHIRALQAKIVDFGLKMEMVMHDMDEEQIDRFTAAYNDCLERMGMVAEGDEVDPNVECFAE